MRSYLCVSELGKGGAGRGGRGGGGGQEKRGGGREEAGNIERMINGMSKMSELRGVGVRELY